MALRYYSIFVSFATFVVNGFSYFSPQSFFRKPLSLNSLKKRGS
jgi:hypothetical protein